ncbi:MAG: M48 family metallopeptidase [Lachnospiraceae bacterium]|nr:M48 family metallopeptidase [Lachnospiraceae bacterium]
MLSEKQNAPAEQRTLKGDRSPTVKHCAFPAGKASSIEYELIRSRRRTLAIQIKPDGSVLVRAPYSTPAQRIEAFINERRDWILRTREGVLKKARKAEAAGPVLTEAELQELHRQAREQIPGRVALYAKKAGVTYGRITIRSQRTRWGSCSSKGNLNFNCLLMLAPPMVLDSVVAHELCHRKEMNHSPKFYAEVRRLFPEYDKWHGWLKKNGSALLARLPE